MSCITLAGSYRGEPEPIKLCGGDIYRSLAPKAPDDGVDPMKYSNRDKFKRRLLKTGAAGEVNPRKMVIWDEDIVEMLMHLYPLISKSQLASRLNDKFPQENGNHFTKNAVAGKYLRINAAKSK
jgi:hypothetical protein